MQKSDGISKIIKKIKAIKRLLSFYFAIYRLIPSMTRLIPIIIATKIGLLIEKPPRINDIIPNIIIIIEANFDTSGPENIPTTPNRTSRIPII